MIQLLFTVILGEMALLLSLVFKTPLKKPVMRALDCLKQGRGPMISRTVKGVLLAVLVSSTYSILKIHYCSIRSGSVNLTTDQVLVANKELVASLAGFFLFFSLMLDRLHHLVRERSSLKKIIIAEEIQLSERKSRNAELLEALEKEIATLKTMIKKLEFECERKANQAEAAEANEMALRKQSEEFGLEYDRLLEYNQTLRNQLQSIDQSLLKDNKKGGGWTSFKSNIMRDGLVQFPWGIQTKSRGERDPEIEAQTSNQSDQYLCFDDHAISLPRHRRPIYQH